jgi:solute carrier family 25 protein 34/35
MAAAPAWLEFVQSGTAAVCATFFVQPFDVMKTRLQLQGSGAVPARYSGMLSGLADIARTEGFRGLQRGFQAASLLQFSNVACRFGFYSIGKRAFLTEGEHGRIAHAKSMAVGAGSGLIAAVVSNPFFLLKTRFQAVDNASARGSLLDAAQALHAAEGVAGFWKGLPAFGLRVVVASSVQLSTYDLVKASLVARGLRAERVSTHFAASLVTGMAVIAAMQPFDLACTRMMSQEGRKGKFRNVSHVLVHTVRTEGPLALYNGALANYARFGPYNCLVFLFLEQFRKLDRLVVED